MMGTALHVMTPRVVGTRLQVVQIALIGIGLAFKRDIAVGIATHRQPQQPFHQVGEVEEHKKHLALLRRVNALMVHHLMAQIDPRVHKQHTQQVDSRESLEW